MLSILRQMPIEDLRQAAVVCGASPDVTPEGIIRALCRECAVLGWGFVPLTREDALFEQIGQRLGVQPGPKGSTGVRVGTLAGLRPRADRGYPALFEVLTLCWRARRRMLAERRLQHQQLERQLRQLSATMEQRSQEMRGALSPWNSGWARGLAVA